MTTEKTAEQTAESMTGRDIVDLDARVVRVTVDLVSQAGPADLARPTPCAGWTLGDLIGHMTAQHYGWTAAALPVAQAVPDGELRKLGLVPFAPGVAVSAQAGLLDQVVAMLGRSPAWPEPR